MARRRRRKGRSPPPSAQEGDVLTARSAGGACGPPTGRPPETRPALPRDPLKRRETVRAPENNALSQPLLSASDFLRSARDFPGATAIYGLPSLVTRRAREATRSTPGVGLEPTTLRLTAECSAD